MGLMGMAIDIVTGALLGGFASSLVPTSGAIGTIVTAVLVVAGSLLMNKLGFFRRMVPV